MAKRPDGQFKDKVCSLINKMDALMKKEVIDKEEFSSTRNTVHLDHLIRLKPITQYGSLRSRDTVHADRPKRFIPIA